MRDLLFVSGQGAPKGRANEQAEQAHGAKQQPAQ